VPERDPSVRGIAAELHGRFAPDPALRISLEVGDCRIRIDTNSPELSRRLTEYFRYFLDHTGQAAQFSITAYHADVERLALELVDWPRDGGKSGRKDAYRDLSDGRYVLKVRTGMQFVFGGGVHAVFGDCLRNHNQVINFVNAQYMSWLLRRGYTLCHAAGVVAGARGLALAGMSGAGKSTLALHLMSDGLRYASNDRLLIKRERTGVRMSGIPKLPRINPGTALHNPNLVGILPPDRLAAVRDLPPEELWELEEKYDVYVDRVFPGNGYTLTADTAALVVLSWNRSHAGPAETRRVDLRDRPDLLAAVMKNPGPFFEGYDGAHPASPCPPDTDAYLTVLSGLPVYEFHGGVDFTAAARVCMRLLD
jgi:HprK-related kinase B